MTTKPISFGSVFEDYSLYKRFVYQKFPVEFWHHILVLVAYGRHSAFDGTPAIWWTTTAYVTIVPMIWNIEINALNKYNYHRYHVHPIYSLQGIHGRKLTVYYQKVRHKLSQTSIFRVYRGWCGAIIGWCCLSVQSHISYILYLLIMVDILYVVCTIVWT